MSNVDFPPFRPHPLLRNRHAQTLAGVYLPAPCEYRAVPRQVTLDDGDRILLHDDCPPDWKPGGRAALLIHGMCGSYKSGYMQRIAAKLNDRGVRTFRKDLRGFGAGVTIARNFCHAGRSEDVAQALQEVAELCPQSPVTLIGFSLGGNLSLKYMGEMEDLAPDYLDSAVVVAPPIDLIHCAHNLRQGFNRFYDWSFVKELHQLLHRRRREVPDLVDRRVHPLPRRLREFDDVYTAPLAGFKNAKDYYTHSSSAWHLSKVTVPTLIIAAADDPIVPPAMFERHMLSSAITLYMTTHGGHLGYIGVAGVDPDRRWLDWRVLDWITQIDRKDSENNLAAKRSIRTSRSPSRHASLAR